MSHPRGREGEGGHCLESTASEVRPVALTFAVEVLSGRWEMYGEM